MADDPALVIDNRAALGGKPGLHAFIVGVSDYPHLLDPDAKAGAPPGGPALGMRKLSSPALTACRIARALNLWSPSLTAPLATIRLLLAPSANERLDDHSLAKRAARPTWENFARTAARWREDVTTHQDNVALFYFGGHGVQRFLTDQVLLLEGFGDGIGGFLNHGVETQALILGMATSPTYPNMGRRQLFMFDACRITPAEMGLNRVENIRDVWAIPETLVDERNCTVLYATAPGKLSYALRGRSTVFGRAFIRAMHRHGAEEDPGVVGDQAATWSVRATSLAASISDLVRQDTAPYVNEQIIMPANTRADFVLRTLARPPRIRVSVHLQPEDDHKRAELALHNYLYEPVCQSGAPINPYPYQPLLQAGVYVAELKLNASEGKPEVSLTRGIKITPSANKIVFSTSNA